MRLPWYIIWSAITWLLNGIGIETSYLDDRISLSSNEIDSDDDIIEHYEIYQQAVYNAPNLSSSRVSSSRRVSLSKKSKGCFFMNF